LRTATFSRVRRTAARRCGDAAAANGSSPCTPSPAPEAHSSPGPRSTARRAPLGPACAQRTRSMCMGNRPPALKPPIAAEPPQSLL
jgi:hypothetical protein